MAITYASNRITITGSKDSGTASSAGSLSFTDSSKSWTINAYAEHILWITGGTGAGQTRAIKSNTSTTLTLYQTHDWDITPDNTSTYRISYTTADIVSACPTQASYSMSSSNLNIDITGAEVYLAATGFLGQLRGGITFVTANYFFQSASGSMTQFGQLVDGERGVDGAVFKFTAGATWNNGVMAGAGRFYATHIIQNNYPYVRWIGNDSYDGVSYVDCYLYQWQMLLYANDSVSRIYLGPTGAFLQGGDFKVYNIDIVNSVCALSDTSAGWDNFDLSCIGINPTVTPGGTPWPHQVRMSSPNTPYGTSYWWNFETDRASYEDDVFSWLYYTGYKNSYGKIYLGNTIEMTVRDDSSTAIEGARIGIVNTNGDSAIVTSKALSSNYYEPVTSTSVATDSDGTYTGPFGIDEGLFVIRDLIMCGNPTYSVSGELRTDVDQTHYGPFDLTIRKYGYQFTTSARNWSSRSSETVGLLDNDYVSATYATAWAYTGIAITGTSDTTALTSAHTMQELYDYSQAWAVQSGNMIYSEQYTTSNGTDFTLITGGLITGGQNLDLSTQRLSGGTIRYNTTGTYSPKLGAITIDFATAGTYNLSGADFGGHVTFTNSSGGAVTVELETGVSYTNTGPNITISEPQVYQSATISGLTAGTRIQLYDTTNSVELYNGTPTFPYTWTDPTAYVADRAIRLRAALVSGTTAKDFIEATIGTATETSPAISYVANQVDDEVYNDNAVDGSAVTGITFTDATTDIVNINIASGSVTWQSIYAAFAYWIFTETGIADDIAYVDAVDSANYRLTAMKIKNTSSPSVPLAITGGYGVDATTGESIDLIDTTGGTLFFAPDHVVNNIVTVSGSNVITGDIADLNDITASEVVTGMQAVAGDFKADVSGLATEVNATSNKNEVIAGLPSEAPTASAVADEVMSRDVATNKKTKKSVIKYS